MNLAQMSAEQFAATQFNATVTGVTIASPPVVTFKVTDQNGNAIAGLGSTSKSATATVASYPNLSFTLAKLVPGKPGAAPGIAGPSKWVSYIVTSVPTATAASKGTTPSSDNTGTLVDNGDGTYKYTFYRDITQAKAQVAAMTFTGNEKAADLGDLTYDPNAVHRLVLMISGNAPGTGTNTPNGVQSTAAVPLKNPVNAVFDFIPATGKVLTPTDEGQRLIVDKASCNECHGKLGGIPGTESQTFHSGSRYDPRLCVTCHTDQRKFGKANVTSTNNVFTGSTNVADGVTVGDFPVLIHRVHKGEMLVKEGYNYAGVKLNETRYPQDIRNCSKCHDSTAPKVAPQASNFKTVPSRLACGSCHDGINFATGQGVTNAAANQAKLEGQPVPTTGTGHIGGAQADDSKCALCHDANSIEKVYHLAITPPNPQNSLAVAGGNNNTNAAWIASKLDNLPPGAIKVTYDVKSVSRNASKQPVIVFRMLQNGTAVPFNDKAAKTEMWDNFVGSPSAYFVFAVPQDGIAAPTDFNASASGYLKTIWNGTATGAGAGTMTGPDASGYYTVTLTGVTVPDDAKMLTGGIGYTYGLTATQPLTQVNLVDSSLADPTRKPRFGTADSPVVAGKKTGGLIVIAQDVQKVGDGYTGRRAIVEDKRCNSCHEELGVFTLESFHAGQRNDGTTCSWCHNPNRTSSGWSADSTSFVHAIHASAKREVGFNWHAASADSTYAGIEYPGILSKCETCHLPGTYDFSASTSQQQQAGRLPRTVATGTLAASISTSPYFEPGVAYGGGFSFNAGTGATTAAAGTTLMSSPTAAACFSCHDTSLARAHMEANGGSIYEARSTALAKTEQCLVCHGSGKIADIKAVHAK
ncbi:MAG TPA: OmcA/MtrC family decaheme c-type cytochrome [Ramlibacter sp.]|uniref:OmcA/MtrC family decaheme c-type cytochrome n=1 Tax=Ramlibacter sp. TaxID=1917967 RepID=UPI002D7F3495|nr:OmcA/MtrC family decaheme c-type cytochrome [Ramlibacter sp.]HET8747233.1 OmcA/MtrC family decaheme c-type cytochrome [Ramlibacter sp.]